MKKLTILIALLITFFSVAQPQEKTNGLLPSLNVFASGSTFKSGFNIGFELNAEMDWGYIAPEMFLYPNLNEETYFHVAVSGGININRMIYPFPTSFRPFVGVGGGMIYRYDKPHPTVLFETGFTYYFNTGLTLGLRGTYQYRTEYSNQLNNFWRENVFLHFGFIIN